MLKLTNARKGILLAVALPLSTLMVAPASAATTATIVPNTTACWAGVVTTTQKGNTFQAKWNNDNTFTLTVTQPMTRDVTLYISDYKLTSPDYKGGCFSTDAKSGTYPQTWVNTSTVTLPKDFSGTKTVSVELPATCENVQVDLYSGDAYGKPLNSTVTKAGHNNYGYIAGNIMLSEKNPACQPGRGGEEPTPTPTPTPETPVTPTSAPAAVTTAPAATLVDTGINVWVISALAALTASTAAFIATRRTTANK